MAAISELDDDVSTEFRCDIGRGNNSATQKNSFAKHMAEQPLGAK